MTDRLPQRIFLERPAAHRERDYLDAAHRSRELHRGLVRTAATPSEYRDYLRRAQREDRESFFVVVAATRELAGVVNLSDISRERSGRLGYYAFLPHAGAGFMFEGVSHVIDVAFRELDLQRLEASIQPGNGRSIALARGLGFRHEGKAGGYLKIGARWRSHERYALHCAEWRDGSRQARLASVAKWQGGRVDGLA